MIYIKVFENKRYISWTPFSVATLITVPGVGASNSLHRTVLLCVIIAVAESSDWNPEWNRFTRSLY